MKINAMKNDVKLFFSLIQHYFLMMKSMRGKLNQKQHCLSMIIKQIHALEKGLCNANIRYGFGISRIEMLLSYFNEYKKKGGDLNRDEIKMSISILKQYISLHDDVGYASSDYLSIRKRIMNEVLCNSQIEYSPKAAGFLEIHYADYHSENQTIEDAILSRHSIREFKSDLEVDDNQLKHAIELATHAPSACNRQPARVYILNHRDFDLISNWKGGVKTFIQQVDKLLIITGQMAAFEQDELFQYCVSSSIFVGYLTLTLHAQGIGSCVLQRQLIATTEWNKLKRILKIPANEQVVCAIAIGIPKDDVKVPISHRLPVDSIMKYVGTYYQN